MLLWLVGCNSNGLLTPAADLGSCGDHCGSGGQDRENDLGVAKLPPGCDVNPDFCPSLGRCVDFWNDPDNCGSCGNSCGEAACSQGHCSCYTGLTFCDGKCFNTSNDRNHCGSCGTVCPSAQNCVSGSCRCWSSSARLCGESCLDLHTDGWNCGACGNSCQPASGHGYGRCVEGHCGALACSPGYNACNGDCVADSVGSCGSACAPCPAVDHGAPVCKSGVCGMVCERGFSPCGSGCCADFIQEVVEPKLQGGVHPSIGQAGTVVAYTSYDSRIRVARWNGSWQMETVEEGQEVDMQGDHLFFFGGELPAWRHAVRDGNGWRLESVETIRSDTDATPAITLDGAGHPVAAYASDGAVRLARFDGAGWRLETVAPLSSRDNLGFAVVVDALDRPHLAWVDLEGAVAYATFDGAEWTIRPIASGAIWAPHAGLWLDGGGRPHVAYIDNTNALVEAIWDGMLWSRTPIAGNAGTHGKVIFDSAGRPQLPYQRWDTGILQWARWTGSSWSVEPTGLAGGLGNVTCPALALGASDEPYLAWGDNDPSIRHAQKSGGVWVADEIDHVVDTGQPNFLAGDWAVYWSPGLGETHWAKRGAAGWQVGVVAGAGIPASLALDAAGRPGFTFVQGSGIGLARWNGASWDLSTVTSDGASGAVGFDSQGPHLAWLSGGNLHYRAPGGADTVVEAATSFAFAIDSSGVPHLASGSSTGVRYWSWSGSDWRNQIATYKNAQVVQLAFGALDTPWIVLHEGSVFWLASHATFWSLEGPFSYDWMKIALDPVGEPVLAVSWLTNYAHRISVGRRTGGLRHAAITNQSGRIYDLGIDPAGKVRVVYYDEYRRLSAAIEP